MKLKQLHTHGIIEYLPKKETPQIHFQLNRAPAQFLHIHQDHYLERKKLHANRIATITQYASLSKTCRSNFIGQYFGDNSTIVCGVCDICLDNKRTDISAADFNQIEIMLKSNTSNGIDTAVLISETKNISPKKIWAILNFLQSEEKITISEEKRIFWLLKNQ